MTDARGRGWRLVVAATCFVLCTAGTPLFAQTSPRILVMPFENVTRDSHIFWLGEGAAVLLADDLNALGADAITRDERRRAFDRLQVPPAASLTDATVIRIGQIVGASEVVVGTLQLEGDVLVLHARGIALEAGRIAHDVTERGPVADLFDTVERVARKVASAPARAGDDARLAHPPVAAFENYVKGLLADTSGTATTYLLAALKLDPTLDRARLALWQVYEDQGEYARALDAVGAVAETSPSFRRARFLAGLAQLDLKDFGAAFVSFKALADAQPTPSILNNLGVVQLRRGGAAAAQAASYFKKAVDADPSEPDFYFNLGYASWTTHDTAAAITWLREGVRRNPADGDAHFVLAAALTATGSLADANRERELARRLSSVYIEWEKRPASDPVPKGLDRVKSDVELPHGPAASAAISVAGARDQVELARFYVDRGRRLVDEDRDREAILELNRALFLSPYDAEAHLLIGRIHLRAGQAKEAIDSFKISIWSADTAEAHAALASAYLESKDLDSAKAEAERALALDPSSPARQTLDRLRDGR